MTFRVAMVGAGGVGGYFGARLAQAGHDLTFVARGAHLDALRDNGLTVAGPTGEATLKVRATDDPRQIGPVDAVLLCVKTWQLGPAIAALPPLIRLSRHGPKAIGVRASPRTLASWSWPTCLRSRCRWTEYASRR